MGDGFDYAAPRDFMGLAGAPVLIATGFLATAKALAGPGHEAYGQAYDLALGIATGTLFAAALLLCACLYAHRLLPGPRSRAWVGRAAWATSRLALAVAGAFALETALPASGLLWA